MDDRVAAWQCWCGHPAGRHSMIEREVRSDLIWCQDCMVTPDLLYVSIHTPRWSDQALEAMTA